MSIDVQNESFGKMIQIKFRPKISRILKVFPIKEILVQLSNIGKDYSTIEYAIYMGEICNRLVVHCPQFTIQYLATNKYIFEIGL